MLTSAAEMPNSYETCTDQPLGLPFQHLNPGLPHSLMVYQISITGPNKTILTLEHCIHSTEMRCNQFLSESIVTGIQMAEYKFRRFTHSTGIHARQ
jgi:hypothetical protein